MIKYLAAYGATAVVFAALDAGWLTFVGPKLYKPVIGEIMTGQVRMGPAIIFYILFIAGIVVLAVRPAVASGRWQEATFLGAVLGLVAYGTYALTDQAILKVWATKLTVLDIGWGTIASAAGATAGYFAARHFAR